MQETWTDEGERALATRAADFNAKLTETGPGSSWESRRLGRDALRPATPMSSRTWPATATGSIMPSEITEMKLLLKSEDDTGEGLRAC